MTDNEMYSIDDLCKTKSGSLGPLLRSIMNQGLAHVKQCELCQARAYICEGCHSNTVLFPFQVASDGTPLIIIYYLPSIPRLVYLSVRTVWHAITRPAIKTSWVVLSVRGYN